MRYYPSEGAEESCSSQVILSDQNIPVALRHYLTLCQFVWMPPALVNFMEDTQRSAGRETFKATRLSDHCTNTKTDGALCPRTPNDHLKASSRTIYNHSKLSRNPFFSHYLITELCAASGMLVQCCTN